jgi:integrase
MARPSMPAGTHGNIRFQRAYTGSGWRARTQVRDWDGHTRPVERTGRTKSAAAERLKVAIRDRVRSDSVEEITPETKVEIVAEAWFKRLAKEGKADTTLEQYRRNLDRHALPALGQLRVRELTISRCDRYLDTVSQKSGPSTAKMCRSVLSGICGLACRFGALAHNPVRDVGTIAIESKPATALTVPQARQLRAFLTYDDDAIRRDLVDLVDMMLATSLRIGEALAISWQDVDLEAGTVRVAGNVRRTTAQGLHINRYANNKLTHRVLELPTWGIALLKRRRERINGTGPVFPDTLGGLRDPSNTTKVLRKALDFAGMEGTSHTFRKTGATLMDMQGRSARNTADQLGHSQPSMTQNKYMGRQVTSTGAASILEALALQ